MHVAHHTVPPAVAGRPGSPQWRVTAGGPSLGSGAGDRHAPSHESDGRDSWRAFLGGEAFYSD